MKSKGFTLIEIMIVLVIIGILMGLISAAAFKAMESAKKSRAEADIATLETAISMYETDVGEYPPQGTTNYSGDNLFKTWLQDTSGQPSDWNGPYMHFKSEDLNGQKFKDPWGAAYKYGKGTGATHNSKFVDIWDASGKSINNW